MRRLLSHVRGLPRESAYIRSQMGDLAYWSDDTEILRQIRNGVFDQAYEKPQHLERPTVDGPAQVETVPASQLSSFFPTGG